MAERDFTDKAKEKLKRYCKEVREEKWCDFTDDCGDVANTVIYNIVGSSKMSAKNTIDTLNYTEKMIESIFNNVHYVDDIAATGVNIIFDNISSVITGLESFNVTNFFEGKSNLDSLKNIETKRIKILYPDELKGKRKNGTLDELLDEYRKDLEFEKDMEFVVAPGLTYFTKAKGKISKEDIEEAEKVAKKKRKEGIFIDDGKMYIIDSKGNKIEATKEMTKLCIQSTANIKKDGSLQRVQEVGFDPVKFEGTYSETLKSINKYKGNKLEGSLTEGMRYEPKPINLDCKAKQAEVVVSYQPIKEYSLNKNLEVYRKSFDSLLNFELKLWEGPIFKIDKIPNIIDRAQDLIGKINNVVSQSQESVQIVVVSILYSLYRIKCRLSTQ